MSNHKTKKKLKSLIKLLKKTFKTILLSINFNIYNISIDDLFSIFKIGINKKQHIISYKLAQ